MCAGNVSMANVTIDGIAVEVADNINIIKAAEAAGIHIPHLCYHPKLSLSGTCRLCLVEVEKMPKLQTACSTTVKDGMVIFTNNEKVRKARQGVLEFLLINHPLDCPVCDQAGECKLQDYAYEYGMGKSRFTEDKRTYPVVEIGDSLVRNMNRCVHCKRCIRFCAEVAGIEQYGPSNRGGKTSIGVFPGGKVTNKFTGTMVDICPVGALTSKDFRFKARVWNLEEVKSVCPMCSTGCAVVLAVKGNKVLRIRPVEGEEADSWVMCDEGRFGFHFLTREDRLTTPMMTRGGQKEPCKWEQAVQEAATELKRAIEKHGADAVAGVCSTQATNEDAAAFARLMTETIKTKNHDYKLTDTMPSPDQTEDFKRRVDHSPNTRGLQALGVGTNPQGSGTNLVEKILNGTVKALVAVGPGYPSFETGAPGLKDALKKLEVLIVLDILPSIFSEAAHVVLPGAAFTEKNGTFTNYAGKIQELRKAVRAPKGAKPEWETLAAISKAMGTDLKYKSLDDARGDAEKRIKRQEAGGRR